MVKNSEIDLLEARIARFFEKYSARRVAGAAFLSGILTLGIALLVLNFTASVFYTLVAFGLAGFVTTNLAFLFMVPSVEELTAGRDMICGAIRNPSRIKKFDTKRVELADRDGKVRGLSNFELKLWSTTVVPFLIKQQRKVKQIEKIVLKDDTVTAAERKEIDDRRREVFEAEKRIESERKQMEDQYRKIEEKMAELSRAEGQAAELDARSGDLDDEALEKAKKEQEEKIAAREREIAELRKALEDERADLEERSAYVTTVEESLVDRLNELTSREAEIEQGEINAGIRSE
jgi:hypothetical protein